MAAVAQGASVTTIDVDVVHRRDAGNAVPLLEFLETVDGRHRGDRRGR